MNGSRVGYERLSPREKTLYENMEKAFAGYADHVECSRLFQSDDIMKVFQTALGDHPSVVYLDRTHLRISSSILGDKTVYFTDVAPLLKRKKKDADLNDAVNRAAASINSRRPGSPYDTLLCIYEYLQDHVQYDRQEKAAVIRMGKSADPETHSAYGALVNGRATCDGFAGAFALLAQKYGFDCTVVSGKLKGGETPGADHSWNVIKRQNTYCHCDVTADANQKQVIGMYTYDYFCVTDEEIRQDHSWKPSDCPLCAARDWSYYGNKGYIASNAMQTDEILKKQCREGAKQIRLRIAPGSSLQGVNGDVLADKLIHIAASFGTYGGIRYLWNEDSRCFHARFE